jgi:S1-C subfamily serine protease
MKIFPYLMSLFLMIMLTTSNAIGSSEIDSVFKVSYNISSFPISSATAFVIRGDNNRKYLISNNHFCQDFIENRIGSFTYENDKTYGIATYFYSDEGKDLCLLTLDTNKVKALKISKKRPKSFSKAYIIGYPHGIGPVYLETFISSIVIDPLLATNLDEALFISEIIMPGHSGSPILNRRGRVIGIIYAGYGTSYGGLAKPSIDIRSFIEEAENDKQR